MLGNLKTTGNHASFSTTGIKIWTSINQGSIYHIHGASTHWGSVDAETRWYGSVASGTMLIQYNQRATNKYESVQGEPCIVSEGAGEALVFEIISIAAADTFVTTLYYREITP